MCGLPGAGDQEDRRATVVSLTGAGNPDTGPT